MRLPSKATFLKWLDAHDVMDIVGVAGDDEWCPFAECCKERYPGYTWSISDGRTHAWKRSSMLPGDIEGFTNPKWAINFIERIDELPTNKQITAGLAKTILLQERNKR